MTRIALVVLALLMFTVPAFAGDGCKHDTKMRAMSAASFGCDCTMNPDHFTSVAMTFGVGEMDGSFGNADAQVIRAGLELVHPLTSAISLIGRYDHMDVDWDSRASWRDVDGNMVTFGLKFYVR